MAYRVQLPLPRVIERGETTTITLPVVNDADAEQTASAGTVDIYLGTKQIVTAGVVAVGPPASYSLAGSVTTDEPLSSDYTEVWSLTGLDTFTVSGHLVRRPYHSRVTDQSLIDVHPEFLEMLPPGETTGETFRRSASETIQRNLISRGRRPWLIFDVDALHDPEKWLALSLWSFDAFVRQVGGPDWLKISSDYRQRSENAWGAINFDYDQDESGLQDSGESGESAQSGTLTTSAGRKGLWLAGRPLGRGW